MNEITKMYIEIGIIKELYSLKIITEAELNLARKIIFEKFDCE